MARSVSAVRTGALAVIVLALILHVVGFATNYWVSVDVSQTLRSFGGSSNRGLNGGFNSNIKGYFGLWKICGSANGVTECKPRDVVIGNVLSLAGAGNINIVDHRFRAIQALETIGLIIVFLVCVGLVICLCSEGLRDRGASTIMGVGAVLAAACILVGVAVMGQGYVLPPLTNVSWSLGLSVVGGVLAFVSGVMVFIARSKEDW